MKHLFSICLILVSMGVMAQNNTPTYTWRMHLPYNSVEQIVESKTSLFVRADLGVYKFDLLSGEVDLLTKVDGFAESEVSRIAYSTEFETLVIGYANGNIDLLKGNQIINFDIIKRNPLAGLKDILDIKIFDNRAYFATSFGVVIIDIDLEVTVDDYQNLGAGGTSLSVKTLGILNDSLFLATPEGIKSAPAYDNSVNLKNFSSWKTNTTYDSVELMEVFNGKLYFTHDSMLYSYVNGTYLEVEGGDRLGYKSLVSSHDKLVICRWEGIALMDQNEIFEERGDPFMQFAITDFQESVWFGGFYRGLIKNAADGKSSSLTPAGPFALSSFDMVGQGNKMWVTSGGHTTAFGPNFFDYGYYVYEDGNWTNSNKIDNPIVGSMLDLTNILVLPDKNEVWLGSFGSGIVQIVDNVPQVKYDHTNSTIKQAPGDRDVAFGLAMDSKENLWIANFETERSLVVRRKDGTWEDFNVGNRRLGEMIVDDFDQVWMLVPRTASVGLLAIKEDGSGVLQKRFLSTGKNLGGLPNNNVKAIALDKDGEIWVGTEEGIAVFYNPSLVFDGGVNADAQQIIIDDGNDIGFLLGNEVINDIKIDGANRKWVATNNGAWLVKEDGSEVIMHLTKENSPLPCNVVNCIGIVPNTGEVFFGTNCGIASFRGDATEANDFHSNTLVFPNPVHPNYEGPITITGLPEDATVKIADVAGRVVYELIATGGTAVWDGRNFNGEKPQTGVYLIFSANKDDADALVSKLLIVR
ncbi:MAG: hypothetical protein COA58_16315 [Bacteroidetes bacterium]|nr:MAG: hypothetical protein COA58_16315 [Bacteroidota bacterium]